MTPRSPAARLQVRIIIDFAYTAHEYLLGRIDQADADLEAKGWEPGLCSSPWKALYITAAFVSVRWAGVWTKGFAPVLITAVELSTSLAYHNAKFSRPRNQSLDCRSRAPSRALG